MSLTTAQINADVTFCTAMLLPIVTDDTLARRLLSLAILYDARLLRYLNMKRSLFNRDVTIHSSLRAKVTSNI